MDWTKVIEKLREQSNSNFKYVHAMQLFCNTNDHHIINARLLGNIQAALATALECGITPTLPSQK